ncbi:MAG: serine/threonine protein kinase [Nannocystaceae bacterium]|nr:serine/threonine protein kinase [Nannocystaceae bacterium]
MAQMSEIVKQGAPIEASMSSYEVLGELGRGGMAEVFLAHRRLQHESTSVAEKLVALKRLKPEFAQDPMLRQMLVEEARLGAGLLHPNLVEAFDLGEHEGEYFFTMELVQGSELRHLVRAVGASGHCLPLAHVLTIVAAIAAGLDYVHDLRAPDGRRLNVVHLDVCPSNVLVGPDGFVKLIDFGIARHDLAPRWVGGEAEPVRLAPPRGGTLAYCSPEQCLGHQVDRRSDVFSLGVILWELTVWGRLYRAPTRAEVFDKITRHDAVSPSAVRDDYAPGLEPIVMRALSRDPDRRYATAGALLVALEEFAHARGIASSTTRLGAFVEATMPAPPALAARKAPQAEPPSRPITAPYPLVPTQ